MNKKEQEYWKNKWARDKEIKENNFARKVFTFIENKKIKKILELGCGLGRDSRYFAKKGFEVVGVDRVESSIKEIKKVTIIKQDIKDIAFSKDTFDVVYAHLSLHYFDDKTTDKIFNKIYNILKPGGYVFIKCKSIDDPLFGKGKKVANNIYVKGHQRHFFSKEYMREKLKKFKIIKIQKTSSYYHSRRSCFIEAFAQKEQFFVKFKNIIIINLLK